MDVLPVLTLLLVIGTPIAPNARLHPCAVSLDHVAPTYDSKDAIQWVTRRTAATRLVRRWEEARAYRDFERDPIAPIPLTRAQALAVPGATSADHGRVVLLLDDSVLLYDFDELGRTREVRFSAGADKGAYTFRYLYECERPAAIVWDD